MYDNLAPPLTEQILEAVESSYPSSYEHRCLVKRVYPQSGHTHFTPLQYTYRRGPTLILMMGYDTTLLPFLFFGQLQSLFQVDEYSSHPYPAQTALAIGGRALERLI